MRSTVGGMTMTANDNRVVAFPGAARAVSAERLLIPERMRDARLARRLNQTELADLVGVSRQAISQFEKGERRPEPEVFAKISDALQQPISYFTAEDAPTFGAFSAKYFRSSGAKTARRNHACDVLAKWFVQCARYVESYVNFPPVDVPSFEPSGASGRYSPEEIEEIALSARMQWGLGLGPISNVLGLLESKGIATCRYDMEGESVGAFSFWSGERPFIFMAAEHRAGVRVRFDLAHELGHLCLHRFVETEEIEDPVSLAAIEKEADRFASAFLLPRASFTNEVFSVRVDAFLALKERWKASIQAMVSRCRQLEIIDDDQYTNLYKTISFRKWRKNEPLDDPKVIAIEQPKLLPAAIRLLLTSGRKSAEQICLDLRLSPVLLESFFSLSKGDLSGAAPTDFKAPSLKNDT